MCKNSAAFGNKVIITMVIRLLDDRTYCVDLRSVIWDLWRQPLPYTHQICLEMTARITTPSSTLLLPSPKAGTQFTFLLSQPRPQFSDPDPVGVFAHSTKATNEMIFHGEWGMI